jgi:hypothetical protein
MSSANSLNLKGRGHETKDDVADSAGYIGRASIWLEQLPQAGTGRAILRALLPLSRVQRAVLLPGSSGDVFMCSVPECLRSLDPGAD